MNVWNAFSGTTIAPLAILAMLLSPLVHGQQPGETATGAKSVSSDASGSIQTPPVHPASTSVPTSAEGPITPSLPADQIPDSPGAVRAQSAEPPAVHQNVIMSQPTEASAQQNPPHEPVGTAAAESVPTVGVAASRPAGAAMAPAKQRRIRSIIIKTGALVGAGVAIGATMALSQASPGRPPGSH